MSLINCTTLAAEIAEWKTDFLARALDVCGEDVAEATAAELDADPSLALEYFLEDKIYSLRVERGRAEAEPASQP